MQDLKLARLPDRTPVKITILVSPKLHQALRAYSTLYRETYGQAEAMAELIPYMLESFLDADREFARARKEGRLDRVQGEADHTPRISRRRRQAASGASSGDS